MKTFIIASMMVSQMVMPMNNNAKVVELADTTALKAVALNEREGSSPSLRTNQSYESNNDKEWHGAVIRCYSYIIED